MFDELRPVERSIIKKFCPDTFYKALKMDGTLRLGDEYVFDKVERGFFRNNIEISIENHFYDLKSLLIHTKNLRQIFAFGQHVSKEAKEVELFKMRYGPIFDLLEINVNMKKDPENRSKFIVWIGKDQFSYNQGERNPHDKELIAMIEKYSVKVMDITSHYRFKKTLEEPDRDKDSKECPIRLKNGEVYTENLRGGQYGVKNDMWDMDGLIYKSIVETHIRDGGRFFVKGVCYEGQDLDDMKTEELEKILHAYVALDKELSNSIIYFTR